MFHLIAFLLVPFLLVKDGPLWNKPATVHMSVCDLVLAAIFTVVILSVCAVRYRQTLQ
jgi:hypothetical protein